MIAQIDPKLERMTLQLWDFIPIEAEHPVSAITSDGMVQTRSDEAIVPETYNEALYNTPLFLKPLLGSGPPLGTVTSSGLVVILEDVDEQTVHV